MSRRPGGGGSRAGRPAAGAALLGLCLVLLLAGCDGSTSTGRQALAGGRLDIYVSLPLIGDSRPSGEAVLGGIRLALAARHARIGRFAIALRVRDDATVSSRGWDPGATSASALAASRDPRAIAYVGDDNSGATAIALPVLNRAEVPEVSPLATAVGLTRGGPEASPGEPQKYYPRTVHTFVRVVPSDAVQSAVLVALQRGGDCERGYVVYDDEVDGRDAAASFQAAAKSAGLKQLGFYQYDPTAKRYTALARRLTRLDPDCVLISALPQDHAAQVTTAIAGGVPHAELFGTAPLAAPGFVNPADGGVSAAVGARLTITDPTLSPLDYPPAGRRLLRRFVARDGAGGLDAIYGYEAMALTLDAIDRASGGGTQPVSRDDVRRALFATRERSSVLGTYSITRYGDTTLGRFGVYRIIAGRMTFLTAVRG